MAICLKSFLDYLVNSERKGSKSSFVESQKAVTGTITSSSSPRSACGIWRPWNKEKRQATFRPPLPLISSAARLSDQKDGRRMRRPYVGSKTGTGPGRKGASPSIAVRQQKY